MDSQKDNKPNFAERLKPYVDLILKLTPAMASFLAAWIAIQYQSASTGASLLNQREQAETELRATMFSNLITPILGDKNKELLLKEQKLLVEMLTLNFHEHVEFKPLLLYVDKQLIDEMTEADKKHNDTSEFVNMRESLISVVRRVRDRQFAILQKECRARGSALCKKNSIGDENDCPAVSYSSGKTDKILSGNPQCLQFSEQDTRYVARHFITSPDHQYEMAISIARALWDKKIFTISIWLYKLDGNDKKVEISQFDFDLTPYDLPFTDNTILDEKHRFALVLNSVLLDPRRLELQVVWFPEGYILPYERPVNFQEIRDVLKLE